MVAIQNDFATLNVDDEEIVLDKDRGFVDPSSGLIFAMNAYWSFGEKIETVRYTARR